MNDNIITKMKHEKLMNDNESKEEKLESQIKDERTITLCETINKEHGKKSNVIHTSQ